jgi:hypothetical protein
MKIFSVFLIIAGKGGAPNLRVLIGSIASGFGANSAIDKISISISSIFSLR